MSHAHHHGHAHAPSSTRAFAAVTLINLAYTALEAGYGFATNSLALLSDALHNLGDVLGLGAGLGRGGDRQAPATTRHTYGWRRATLLSPLANALLLVAFSGALGWEACRRFSAPPRDPGAAGDRGRRDRHRGQPRRGLAGARAGTPHDLNRRGAFLHLLADAAVSLAAVLAGAGHVVAGLGMAGPGDGAADRRGGRDRRLRPVARELQRRHGRGAARHRPGRGAAISSPAAAGRHRRAPPAHLVAGRGRDRDDRAPGAARTTADHDAFIDRTQPRAGRPLRHQPSDRCRSNAARRASTTATIGAASGH